MMSDRGYDAVYGLLAALPKCTWKARQSALHPCGRLATTKHAEQDLCDQHAYELPDCVRFPWADAMLRAVQYVDDSDAYASKVCECGTAFVDTGIVIDSMPAFAETRCPACGRRGARQI